MDMVNYVRPYNWVNVDFHPRRRKQIHSDGKLGGLSPYERMSSREIEELTGKRHRDVMRDIRNCEPAYLEVYGTQRKFALSKYKDGSGKLNPEYILNKSQTLFLVSGYDALLRAKIQKRWEELESKQPQVPLPTRWASDDVTISSREIAELTEKGHNNVLVDCCKLHVEYTILAMPNLGQVCYTLRETGSQCQAVRLRI